MEFKVKTFRSNNDAYSQDEIDIAYKFSERSMKEFGKFIKAIVLFGSSTKRKLGTQTINKEGTANESIEKREYTIINNEPRNPHSDIDILHIIDDVSIVLSKELVETYEVLSKKLIQQTSTRIHLTTLTFSSFWELIKVADPIAINILREGMPIIDTGFYMPLQKLLFMGRIRPTEESIWTYFSRAPRTLTNSRMHLIHATVDLYWAVIDAAHAALMKVGQIPPSPSHVAGMLEEKLVKKNHIERKYAQCMDNFYEILKMIEHREVSEITGEEYEKYYKEAEEFVKVMEEFIDKEMKKKPAN